jgi:hypothetical protein
MTKPLSLTIAAALVAVLLSFPSAAADKKGKVVHNDPKSSYEKHTFHGWTVLVSKRFGDDKDARDKALKETESQLYRITGFLPDWVLEDMKKTEIWLEYDFPGRGQYHPSKAWLKGNGYNPEKAKTIEIPNSREFVRHRGASVLTMFHELLHAWHDRVLGFGDKRIIEAHKRAVASGKYDSVMRTSGRRVEHYALSTHQEFFAEMSEAWFYVNDYYPFVRAEIQQYDPKTFELLKELWTKPKAKKGKK